jgi:hypothetical protein
MRKGGKIKEDKFFILKGILFYYFFGAPISDVG